MRKRAIEHGILTHTEVMWKIYRKGWDKEKSKHIFQKFKPVSTRSQVWYFKKHNAWLIGNEFKYENGEERIFNG
jgi:hypothetical protein